MSKLSRKNITGELWRRYCWRDAVSGRGVITHFDNPVYLWFQSVGSTHRIQNADGNVFVVPSPGNFGCTVQYRPRDLNNPVQF